MSAEQEGTKEYVTCLIRMMYQALSSISFLDLNLRAFPCQPQDLVVVLRLTPLQRRLCLLQINLECTNVTLGSTALRTRLLYGGFEISDRGVILLEVKVDPRSGPKRFEGVG
jgi:hypothetical protein